MAQKKVKDKKRMDQRESELNKGLMAEIKQKKKKLE